MRSMLLLLSFAFLTFFSAITPSHAAWPKCPVLATSGLQVRLAPQGKIVGIRVGPEVVERPVVAETSLAGCVEQGPAQLMRWDEGGVEFERGFVHEKTRNRATLVERFLVQKNNIRWEWEVRGKGEPWTTPIVTRVAWPNAGQTRFWTAWNDTREKADGWSDPLRPQPLVARTWTYGNDTPAKDKPCVSIPLVCLLDPASDAGLSVVLSPEDLMFDVEVSTTTKGDVVFSREFHRLGEGKLVRGALDLVGHPADWRAGLGWMARRYPAYFNPPNLAVRQMDGCGGYSSHAPIQEAERLARMAFRVNWKASFDFPYMGMFLPPVASDDDEWIDFKKQTTSLAKMRASARTLRRMGFYEMNYFNVTECGAFYEYPPPPRKAIADADLWKDANDFLYYALGDAILPGPDGKPIASWEGCVAMDPGEKVYQDFLVGQAHRHIDRIPESMGICIDRMDWVHFYNRRRDDGVTWFEGRPARSLVVSWREIMDRLGPLMHGAGKVIYGNPHYARVDLMKHLDGIYDEAGMQGVSLNLCALMGINKPVMEWTWAIGEKGESPDAFFQRHLHMGAYLTAPVPGNDHAMLPKADRDRFYLDYGPLLDALRGRRWLLMPHVVRVEHGRVLANVFEIPGGFVVSVTFGGKESSATIVLRDLPRVPRQKGFRAEAIHPGDARLVPVSVEEDGNELRIDVPLERGCSMLLLRHLWMEPRETFFHDRAAVELGSTLRDVSLHFTLDGSEPTPASPAYASLLELEQTTVVKVAAFRDGRQIGSTLEREYVRILPDPPHVAPTERYFDDTLEVTLDSPNPGRGEVIRYTLDGTEPTRDSPRYEAPIHIDRTLCLQAARFTPESAGLPTVAEFQRRGPRPPKPDVSLTAISSLKATVDWGGKPRVNRSIGDSPLTLGGVVYPQGIGVSANSELEYELKSEYARFVAVVGLDDAMRHYRRGTIVFEVWTDQKRVFGTPVMRPGDCTHVNVPIPAGSKRIRLLVHSTGDGITCDHGDWAEAGFVTSAR